MREFMRELLSANLFVTGIILTIAAIVVFYGSTFLLTWTNLGKKLAFLVTGAAVFGWLAINSLLFVLYAPRGPRPVNIEGLNAFEIRIIPLTYMIVSVIIFIAFVIGLKQYEEIQSRSAT
jgi:hypothetical protein